LLSNRSSFCLILFVILLISLTAAAVAGTLLLKADLAEFIKDASGVK
jgi:CHASE1-domain containing sensor protein